MKQSAMAANGKRDSFRVIIVGGSVAGLTLALSLERAGIDYLVLEARDQISPQVGASIGIFSNGARILDQLGIYDSIEQHTDPPIWHDMLTGEGTLVQKVDSLRLMQIRTGYPVAFLERRQVLQLLYDHFPNRSKILTGKRVLGVDHLNRGVRVHCDDGSDFTGDIVAGADGVHSQIRQAMWQHAESHNALKHLKRDRQAMFAEYRCLFGISSAVPGLAEKTQYRTFNKDWSFLVVVGKDCQCFWFVFEKLDKVYRPPNMPSYNKDTDQNEFVKQFMARYVAQTVTFGALWQRRTAATLTVLEEAQYTHWTYDRIVCLGDAIHKMTPNIGQGGNWAIESAAALTNKLNKLLMRTKGRPVADDIRAALKDFEQSRHARTKEVCETAGFATRLEAFATLAHRLMSMYVVPYAGDMLVDVHCQAVAGAPKLDFLPPPEKSLRDGTVFQTARFVEPGDNPAWRALRALPLLATCLLNYQVLGSAAAAVVTQMDGAADRRSLAALMTDLAALQTVGMVETVRRGNNFTLAALWPVFALVGHWKGLLGYAAPVYFFVHYVQCSPDRFAAPDNRLVPRHYAKTILAAVAVGYILPAASLLFADRTHPRVFERVWQVCPLITALVHRAFASAIPNTTATERVQNPYADMRYLRLAYAAGVFISGATYCYLAITSKWYTHTFWSDALQLWQAYRGLAVPAEVSRGQLIRYHHLITFGSSLLWELLHFRDLRRAGRLNTSYLKVAGVLFGTAMLMGPGAAMALAWAWREEVLARKARWDTEAEKRR
ncbi:hypothetical protein DL764_008700 [Monosporascus ibericus]|uniref:FAD-binding domain-containing protein n=1 Tax=Monosporascus ibericus TaxID=155417 RepID=A0A4Q4SZV0_9PEZI|nr:hypothetical protein DL764_008700 [Monosporascus ibericus]